MSTKGTYAGRTSEQRRAERRRRLVDAARETWGEHGWAAVSMRGVCARAGLVDRYFYESFAGRDALLVAVWEQERDRLVELVQSAVAAVPGDDPIVQLQAAVTAAVGHLDRHPRVVRIVLGDNVGSAALAHARRDTLQLFTDIVAEMARPHLGDGDEDSLRMAVLMGVGGFVELVTAWQDGLIDVDADTVVAHVTDVGAALAGRYLRGGRTT